jgi:hypothetical protein
VEDLINNFKIIFFSEIDWAVFNHSYVSRANVCDGKDAFSSRKRTRITFFSLSRSFPFASSSLFHFIYQPTDDVTFVGIKKTTHLTLVLS